MSINGQTAVHERPIPPLDALPRPLYARSESLARAERTRMHHHPWVQLSYAIRGVLHVHTPGESFVAPPQRAVWIPAQMEHEVFSFANTEMRSLYLDATLFGAPHDHCRVIEITPLTHELIKQFCTLETEYDEQGEAGRLSLVLVDQLRRAREVSMSLPLPQDPRALQLCRQLQDTPDDARTLAEWGCQLGASEKTLRRILLRETGLSFRIWRQRLRLLGSIEELGRGVRVTQVALNFGYQSTSAYIAAFREHFGVTPGDFFSG
ncbi:helix-turn-helix transcriptional regulator [Pseudomonas sp. DTU_2021_1001937_2_SI_NGA_ILE_001]|uniref:AraC family transcriptional regulator n=1 Tax=Pseudomonas sp. DTU_2021_1001937_2_SI_NGA_ILE_001 TaxID=3077589 RepID=UPI0025EE658D|nr:helix-turn-helix transcriptional regulator [Pseudomonas sp. DTU_2021_1001937_2_SI_NGA_ILE_001]WNW09954.1 helix-turn-helix transcriptional regulator [Pseudomonas sp. DTU_2021_1001937_2_SI_NGA_ILE_001]